MRQMIKSEETISHVSSCLIYIVAIILLTTAGIVGTATAQEKLADMISNPNNKLVGQFKPMEMH